jgi:hypothetical protein
MKNRVGTLALVGGMFVANLAILQGCDLINGKEEKKKEDAPAATATAAATAAETAAPTATATATATAAPAETAAPAAEDAGAPVEDAGADAAEDAGAAADEADAGDPDAGAEQVDRAEEDAGAPLKEVENKDVTRYPGKEVPQGGTVRLLKGFTVRQAADHTSKELSKVGAGTLVDLKVSYGQWFLIMYPSGPGQLSPGWIELVSKPRPRPIIKKPVLLIPPKDPVVKPTTPIKPGTTTVKPTPVKTPTTTTAKPVVKAPPKR